MTMQVGMFGSDGVVIASDTLWMNNESNQYADVRHTSDASKIVIDHEKGLAIACARNLEVAGRIAQDVIRELEPDDWSWPESKAERTANAALAQSQKRKDIQCIMATTKPELAMFHLHAGVFAMQEGARCQRQYSTIFAGDTVNAAVFWRERYYSSWEESLLPIDQLIPLAAHIVLSAGHLGRGAIGGLEVVRCDASGVRRLSDFSVTELKRASREWDARFGKEILGYCQQFTYAPNVIR